MQKRTFPLSIGLLLAAISFAPVQAESARVTTAPAATVETIVFLRHGEKPTGGLGQLSPQGFNRALALVEMLPKRFGRPDFLFAPNPAGAKMREGGGVYDYVRPLATIEPLAISLGMPVQTPYGFSQIDQLNAELTSAKYQNALIFVAWEHIFEEKAVIGLVKQFGGDPAQVPHWSGGDYDSLYVVTITRSAEGVKVKFQREAEGLNNLGKAMPTPSAK
jgi:hypothetical protein